MNMTATPTETDELALGGNHAARAAECGVHVELSVTRALARWELAIGGGSIESDAPGTTRRGWTIPVPRSR